MARELRTVLLCDHELAESDTRTEGATHWEITINGTAYEVEACAEHGQPYADALAALERYGRPVKGTKRGGPRKGAGRPPAPPASPEDAVTCPECGKTYGSLKSLVSHGNKEHSMGSAAMRAALDGEEPPTEAHPCPECGKVFATRQALGTHRWGSHKVAGETRAEHYREVAES